MPSRSGEYPRMSADRDELVYLESGMEPPWTRVWREGVDMTDHPEVWTAQETAMRARYAERLAVYAAQLGDREP